MARREVGEINAGSMADIAFLLLIFFLVTTTMDVDSGITRKLPPWEDEPEEQTEKIKERNIYIVLVNRNNQLLVEGELYTINQLRRGTKEFIENPGNNENLSQGELLSEKIKKAQAEGKEKKARKYMKAQRILGRDVRVSKGVVSLQNDRQTDYGVYIRVQNELVAAFNELREDLAIACFQKKYDDLTETQQEAIQDIYPLSISEAEPRHVGKGGN